MSAITDLGMKAQISVNDIIAKTNDPLNFLKRQYHIG